jgi:nudix-type nucleoside diphosphatase (YffH/AdpP family)
VRIVAEEVLSDDWYLLQKVTFDFRRRDGSWQRQSREVYDRGDGAVLLLYNAAKGTVLLTRQFRLPAFVNQSADGYLIEACAGLLDGDDAASCIKREAEEETGYRVLTPRHLFDAYMSPGSVTEYLRFFVAEYQPEDRVTSGGGDFHEGEDIETLEIALANAVQMIDSGEIRDGKTIMLLLHAHRLGLKGLSA